MTEIKDGGSAFPSEQHETLEGNWNQTFDPGMTLRDWFAGQALAGALASDSIGILLANSKRRGESLSKHVSLVAYEMADAMLSARTGGGDNE